MAELFHKLSFITLRKPFSSASRFLSNSIRRILVLNNRLNIQLPICWIAILQSAILIKNGCINCRLSLTVISNEFGLCNKILRKSGRNFKDLFVLFYNERKPLEACKESELRRCTVIFTLFDRRYLVSLINFRDI